MNIIKLMITVVIFSLAVKGQTQSFLSPGNMWVFRYLGSPEYSLKTIQCTAETTIVPAGNYFKIAGLHYFFPQLLLKQVINGVLIFNPKTGLIDYIFEFGSTTQFQLNIHTGGGNSILATISPGAKQSAVVFGEADTLYPYRVIIGFDGGFKVLVSRKFGFVYYEQYEFSSIYFELIGIKLGDQIYGTLTGEKEEEPEKPSFNLSQNYPNPFNSLTTITYSVPSGHALLEVFDLIGRRVCTLVNEEKERGNYTASFDAANLPNGVYFCTLKSGTKAIAKKLLVIR